MTTMVRADQADAFLPEEFGKLVDKAVQANSVAALTATLVPTSKQKISFPVWVSDPAVGWYNENDLLDETEGSTDSVECIPTKTAGWVPFSNELADDSSPAVENLISKGLSRQIIRAIDGGFLGNTTAKGPNGLLSIAYSVQSAGASLANLDAFNSARFRAIAAGSTLTAWVMHPDVAETLTNLKTATGSNLPLLEFVETGIAIAGLPVLLSDQVDANTVAWGIPQEHVNFVLRAGTKVEKFPVPQRDGQALRAISRIGLAFTNEPGVVRIVLSPLTFHVTLTNASSGETWTVKVAGVETGTIAYNAAASAVKSAIVAVDDGISADDVTVTGDAGAGYTVTVPVALSHGTDSGDLVSSVVLA